MPAFAAVVAAIFAIVSRLLMTRAGMWLVSVMMFLGLAFTTNAVVVDPIVGMIETSAGGLPSDVMQWAGALGIDKVLSIIISAYTLRAAKRVFLARRATP